MSNPSPLIVAIDTALPTDLLAVIRALSPRIVVHEKLSPDVVRQMHVLYTYLPGCLPSDAPSLKWVQLDTASIAHVRDTPIGKSRVPIVNVRGAYSVSVAEFAIGLLLMLTRRLHTCHEMKLRGQWLRDAEYPGMQGITLHDKTMGIVGYGSIGRHIARIASALGMKILAWKMNPSRRIDDSPVPPGVGDPQGTFPTAWFGPGQLQSMLSQSDIAMIALPQTAETRAIVGAEELASMPRGARVVNVGRGSTIDEASLVRLLASGHLAGAALDVFADEPLPESSPLWRMPNVVISPHIASYTDDQTRWAGQVLIENLKRELAGQPLINLVNLKAGY